ncbi:MAG TPA: hypothetical protein VF247_07770 [Candidatus Krumholzibacteria bacterium]
MTFTEEPRTQRAVRAIDAIAAWRWLLFIGVGLCCGLVLIIPVFAPASSVVAIPFLIAWVAAYALLLLGLWTVFEFFRSIRRRKMSRKTTTLGAICFAGFSMVIVTSQMHLRRLPPVAYGMAFDRNAWLDPASDEPGDGSSTARQRMLGDLVKQLRGQRRPDIEKMLGTPFEPREFRTARPHIVYRTGPRETDSHIVFSELLVIYVDENGIYQKYDVLLDSRDGSP